MVLGSRFEVRGERGNLVGVVVSKDVLDAFLADAHRSDFRRCLMFEGSLVESRGLIASETQKWTALGSLTVQCAVAGLLIAIPLLRPQMLGIPAVAPPLEMPLLHRMPMVEGKKRRDDRSDACRNERWGGAPNGHCSWRVVDLAASWGDGGGRGSWGQPGCADGAGRARFWQRNWDWEWGSAERGSRAASGDRTGASLARSDRWTASDRDTAGISSNCSSCRRAGFCGDGGSDLEGGTD